MLASSRFLLRNILPQSTNINFMRYRNPLIVISVFLILLTFWGLFRYSLNFGIDFTGGILIEARFPEAQEIASVRKAVSTLDIGEVNIQTLDDVRDVMVRVGVKEEQERDRYISEIKNVLIQEVSSGVQFRKVEFIGAEVGQNMIQSSGLAVFFTMLGILFYVWYRFDLQYSIGVILGLIHDLILTLGFLVIMRFEFNSTSIAAILTILGYSVNDTVVIYDRVRENVRKIRKQSFINILNLSVNETLTRTILTVLTTLIAVLALVLYGGEALRSFSVTVFVGIIIGTYSSVFVSVPVITFFKKHVI
jgi:preprotein translocase subunit SecF